MMRKHSGMRPHDVVILLKIATKGKQSWLMKDLSNELDISASEISESINRSLIAGFISHDKKTLNKLALLDFLACGLSYVYPQQPGALVRGIATAHSAEPLVHLISSDDVYVIPYAKGDIRGQLIEPLHPKLPTACLKDEKLYELIALADTIRVGKAREKKLAIGLIKEWIINA